MVYNLEHHRLRRLGRIRGSKWRKRQNRTSDLHRLAQSLIFNNGEPFLHQMDVDDDGNDDIEVGLTLEFDFNGGWGINGDRLWIKPTIQFKVDVIEEESPIDPAWDNLERLEVSLVRRLRILTH